MDKHLHYMQRAFELAEKARGKCSPNPFVGAVIVKDDTIISEGFTQPYGFDHAEEQAIKHCSQNPAGAEIYVTLEPCSHYGKTPPCAKAIAESGIRSVFVGIKDPNPLVSGKGIEMLKDAKIQVESGFLADKITRQLETYLTYITKSRPFVTLKSAISLDGRIAAQDGSSRWISCEESRKKTHELRQENDSVLTGIGTVLKDNPLLNVRLPETFRQPLRVILDSQLRLPLDSQITATAKELKTLVFCCADALKSDKADKINEFGIEICPIDSSTTHLPLDKVLGELHKRKITSVLVEAGAAVNTSFLKAGLVDKLIIFIAPKLLGGDKLVWQDLGVQNFKQAIELKEMQAIPVGSDYMITGYF